MWALARNLSASSPEVFIDIGNIKVGVGAQVEVGAQPLG